MKLTGKAKEQFEKWLIDQNTGMVLDTEAEPWVLLYDMVEAARWGFYQDWADSLGYRLMVHDGWMSPYVWGFNIGRSDKAAMLYDAGMPNKFETRQEARNAAIEKLNEIINQIK